MTDNKPVIVLLSEKNAEVTVETKDIDEVRFLTVDSPCEKLVFYAIKKFLLIS